MEYILDTNICIYIIKRKPIKVFERFRNHEPGTIGVSTITVAELEYGISKSLERTKNTEALRQFLNPLQIHEFNTNAASEYGKIRAALEKNGTVIGSMDLLIAAHTFSLGMTLVTNNEKEFKRVEGLSVENWV